MPGPMTPRFLESSYSGGVMLIVGPVRKLIIHTKSPELHLPHHCQANSSPDFIALNERKSLLTGISES